MTKLINIWEAHGRVYDRPIGNPYIDPPAAPKKGKKIKSKIKSLDDFLVLENIVCVDADGNEFEKYDHIYVQRKVEKDTAGGILKLTPYAGISHCEQLPGSFLPSSALLANIYVALHKTAVGQLSKKIHDVSKEEAKQMLEEFKDRGDGFGGQWANTLLNWGTQEIVHYPQQSDFPTGGRSNINSSLPRRVYPFHHANFKSTDLLAALSIPNFRCYVQNYTGLSRPEDLLGVAQYFGKTAHVWISTSTVFRAAWFGWNSSNFNLGGCSNLDYGSAVRGVQRANASNQG